MRPALRGLTGMMAALTLASSAHAGAPEYDTTAVEYFAAEAAFYGDVRLRWDEVRDRPGVSGDLDARRLMMRGGLIWAPANSPVRIEAGLRFTASEEQDRPATTISPTGAPEPSPWVPVLNEDLNDATADRLNLRIAPPGGTLSMTVGRQRSPLRLSEMTWDDDLRPGGVSIVTRRELSPSTTGRLGFALFVRHGTAASDGWLGAAQASALFREEAPSGAEATVSWLRFGRDFAPSRQNETSSIDGHAAEFHVIDLQLGARANPAGVPVGLRLDLARNVAHPRDRDAVRVRLAIGGAGVPAGAEVGWVFQRIEREAVPGAFNSDDWWFHTRMRGNQLWLRVGFGGNFEARVAGFHERRDDLSRPTRRLTAELTARLPSR